MLIMTSKTNQLEHAAPPPLASKKLNRSRRRLHANERQSFQHCKITQRDLGIAPHLSIAYVVGGDIRAHGRWLL
jgi:hypothetical protein